MKWLDSKFLKQRSVLCFVQNVVLTIRMKRNSVANAVLPWQQCGDTSTSRSVQNQKMKIGIIIGTIFIPLIGIIMGAIHWNDPNPEDKRTARIWLYTGIGIGVVYILSLKG